MNYNQWNELFVKYFFNENKAYEDITLYLNEDILNSLYKNNDSALADFTNAIKVGPFDTQKEEICDEAFMVYKNWHNNGRRGAPPYVAYLAFFVLAASTEDDSFVSYAYYPKLWKLLGYTGKYGAPSRFDKMYLLWEDLEKWSCEENHEALGRFIKRVRGKWRHVGIPLFQTLSSTEELRALPKIFLEAELDPIDVPTPEVMMGIIYKYGGDIFKKRTLKMIYGKTEESSAFTSALTNLVLEQLERWDGSYPNAKPNSTGKLQQIQMVIRICLNLDQLSGSVRSYIRFHSKRTIPEEGLILINDRTGENYNCFGYTNGWSNYLRYEKDQEKGRVRAEYLDWGQGERLEDETGEWKAVLRPSNTRVFLEGFDNLKDWVEVQRVERGKEYLIASRDPDLEKVDEWGANSSEKFVTIESSGLPKGWKLFRCKNISASCPGVDLLTISNQSRLKLLGGIKAGGRNPYFEFARPRIVVENGTGNETIKVNGKKIERSDVPDQWILSGDYEGGAPIYIEAFQGDENIGRRMIYLEFFETLPTFENTPFRSPEGGLSARCDTGPCGRGAMVIGLQYSAYKQDQMPLHLSSRIIFIGSTPGQVIDWPEEQLPKTWEPVWAIARVGRDHWQAHYCANTIERPYFGAYNRIGMEKKTLRRWREAVYINRKKTSIPKLGVLRRLWQSYQECAKNVK